MAPVLVVVTFCAMEPATYAVHRWLMHGPGRGLHRSHHRLAAGRFEANDLYPAAFAGVVGLALLIGFNVDGLGWLVPIGAGVTLYGVAYAAVHDGHIHGRLPFLARRHWAWLDRLAAAHRIHHRDGGEPYGMLLPLVPARRRGAAVSSEPSRRTPIGR